MSCIFISGIALITGNFTLPFGLAYLNPEVKWGDLLTFFSIVISVSALYHAWSSDQKLRAMKYADQIRNSFGISLAKLERRQKIKIQSFYRMQPSLLGISNIKLETDKKFNSINERIRDYFSTIITKERSRTIKNVLDENIEITSKDLYGFNLNAGKLLLDMLKSLDEIERWVDDSMLRLVEKTIMYHPDDSPIDIRELLWNVISNVAYEYNDMSNGLIDPFRSEVEKIIRYNDVILNKDLEFDASIENLTTEVYKNASSGLFMRYSGDYGRAIKFYRQASNGDKSIRGYQSGMYLAFKELEMEYRIKGNIKKANKFLNISNRIIEDLPAEKLHIQV